MNRLVNFARKLRFLACAGAFWLAAGAMAWAQVGQPAPPGQQAEETPPPVVPYAIVILCIGLAIAIILNPSKRRDRAKPEVYGEPK